MAGSEPNRRRRRPARLLLPLGAAAAVAVAVIGAALFILDPEPEAPATSLPPATTLPATTTTGPPDGASTTTSTTMPAPPAAPEATVTPTLLRGGEVLFASPDGVFVDGPAGLQPITTAPAVLALGDRRGGLLYQSQAGPGEQSHIWHLPALGTQATLAVPDAELQDTALVDGEPTVIYTQHAGVGEGSVQGRVFARPIAGGQAPVLVFDGFDGEGAITRVSYGGGTFAITQAAEGFEWFTFVDIEGRPVDVVNPRPADDGGYADQGVLDDDGTVLAFLDAPADVLGAGEPIDVVVWDLREGGEFFRVRTEAGDDLAADASYWFVRADYDGRRMVVERIDEATRASIGHVVVELGERAVTAGVATGAPAIVDFVAPPPPPDPAEGAVVPDAGFGRGTLVANWERVLWYGQPLDGPVPEPRLVWEFTAEEATLGEPRYAYTDGEGGVIFGGGPAPMRRLRPGAAEAEVVAEPPGGFFAVFGVAQIGGAPTAFGTQFTDEGRRIVTLDLESGASAAIAAADAGIANLSFDGERFWVATVTGGAGDYCTGTVTIGLDGRAGAVAGDVASCDADTLYEQARVSPDGTLVAYVESPFGEGESEFGEVDRRPPLDLVVAATADGTEIARAQVGTEAQDIVLIHDFDGERVVVSRQAPEPAVSEQVVFVVDLRCGGCTARVDTFLADAGLTGPADPVTAPVVLEPLPGCSTDGRGVFLQPQDGLPGEVALMRAAILDAADRCDFATLQDIALDGVFSYDFDSGDPLAIRTADLAREDLWRITAVLDLPYGTVDAGGETIYVWPRVATYDTWDEVTVDEQNQLSFVYDFPTQRQFEEFGAYIGLRVGITASGDWIFVATGD